MSQFRYIRASWHGNSLAHQGPNGLILTESPVLPPDGSSMETASFLTKKAIQCRRLAAVADDDHACDALLAFAEELETQAAERATCEDSEEAISAARHAVIITAPS
jgi:hypothetical protein